MKIRDISNGNVIYHHLYAAVHKYSVYRWKAICVALLLSSVSSTVTKQWRLLTAPLCFHRWKELWLSWGSYADEKLRYVAEPSANLCFLQGFTHQKATAKADAQHQLLNLPLKEMIHCSRCQEGWCVFSNVFCRIATNMIKKTCGWALSSTLMTLYAHEINTHSTTVLEHSKSIVWEEKKQNK